MAVEVATFTPRAPVSLFESQRLTLDTVFKSVIRPNLFVEINTTGEVARLRRTTAVLTALAVSNTSASARTVDVQVVSSRQITYQANVTAQAGQNWVRINRILRPTGVPILGYDWSQTPPVRLVDEPVDTSTIVTSLAWTSTSAYLAATQDSPLFNIYDANNAFAIVYTSGSVPSPVRVLNCVWSPDDRYLAVTYRFVSGTTHPYLKVFDFDSGITTPVEVPLPSVTTSIIRTPSAIAWGGPGGRYLVASNVGTARFVAWDWNSGSPVLSALGSTLSAATSGVAGPVAFNTSVGSPRVAVGHSGGARLSVFDFPTATTLSKIDLQIFATNTQRTIPVDGLSWSADNRYLAVLSADTDTTPFTVYDFNSGVVLRNPPDAITAPMPELTSLDWSQDGRYLVIGHAESERYTYYPDPLTYLLLYDYDTGSPVRITASPALQATGQIAQVRFSPDGNTLMVAGWRLDRFYPPTGVDNVRLLDGAGANRILNGSFEDTTGLTAESFGFSAIGAIPNWFVDGDADTRIFLPTNAFVNTYATDGRIYLDPVVDAIGTPPQSTDVRLRQNISGLTAGQTYTLLVDVTSVPESSLGIQITWNGSAVSFEGETVLSLTKDIPVMSVLVPPGETVQVPLEKHMLSYGEILQIKASGSGVDAAVSYILSTQEGDGE